MQLRRVHQFHPHTFNFIGDGTRKHSLVFGGMQVCKKFKNKFNKNSELKFNIGHRLFQWGNRRTNDRDHRFAPFLHQIPHWHIRICSIGCGHCRPDTGGKPRFGMERFTGFYCQNYLEMLKNWFI